MVNRVRRNRGDLFVRTVIALAAGAAFLYVGADSAVRLFGRGNAAEQTRADFARVVSNARHLASRDANGATIKVVQNGTGSTVSLYTGLPDGRTMTLMDQHDSNTLTFNGNASFGLFFDEHGAVTATAPYPSGTLAGPPSTCVNTYTILETIPTGTYTITIDCEEDTAA